MDIVFSGTTGKPKAIVHRTGGMILEHFKALAIHQNVDSSDSYFWYSTTGWMMWNYALSSLLLGSTLCIYNGSPVYPDSGVLWRFTKKIKNQSFWTWSSFLSNPIVCSSKRTYSDDFSFIKTVGSTGFFI